MLPFGVTIPATVPQRSEIAAGPMNYPVHMYFCIGITVSKQLKRMSVNLYACLFSALDANQ